MPRRLDIPACARPAAAVAALVLSGLLAAPAEARCTDGPKARVDWTGCSKPQLMLNKDDLSGAVFAKADLTGTEFVGSKLAGAKFEEAEISHSRFDGADLLGADLHRGGGLAGQGP